MLNIKSTNIIYKPCTMLCGLKGESSGLNTWVKYLDDENVILIDYVNGEAHVFVKNNTIQFSISGKLLREVFFNKELIYGTGTLFIIRVQKENEEIITQ